MIFNSDPLKKAQRVIFSRKRNKPHHPDIIFSVIPLKKCSYQKHFGIFLNSKLDFDKASKYLIKLVNLFVFFASSDIFYRNYLFYKSINLLLDLT